MNVLVCALTPEDWPAVRAIYLQGIETRNATFETVAPEWQTWDAAHRPDCRLVARVEGKVAGWAALSPVSARAVYRGVAEVSVYVAEGARGVGLGKRLLSELVSASEQQGVWTLQAGISRRTARASCCTGKRGFGLSERASGSPV